MYKCILFKCMFSVCIHWIVHLHAPSFAYLITPGVGVEGEFPCENVGDARREKRPFWVCLELYLSPERYHFKTDRKRFFKIISSSSNLQDTLTAKNKNKKSSPKLQVRPKSMIYTPKREHSRPFLVGILRTDSLNFS